MLDIGASVVLGAMGISPLVILVVGIVTVIGMIVWLRINAFLALITAAIVVSLMADGEMGVKISRVASAFGGTAGGIGIVIALAAVIGKCMMDSGAADRIVRFFIGLMGEKRGGTALMSSGFVLAVPVFFDTVFYLLVPLARSMYRSTKKHYLKYIMAIGAGGAITHTLVPPTPGPLVMADTLGVDIGMMMMIGALCALPAAVVGLWFGGWLETRMDVPMRPLGAGMEEPEALDDSQLPSLFVSLLPVLLPILLITSSTVLNTMANGERRAQFGVSGGVKDYSAFAAKVKEEVGMEGNRVGKQLVARLNESDLGKKAVGILMGDGAIGEEEEKMVEAGLNALLGDRKFYDKKAFLGILPGKELEKLLKGDRNRMQVADVERLNRLGLEGAYPELIEKHEWNTSTREMANASNLFGNANFALMLSAAVAMITLVIQRRPSGKEFSSTIEGALASGGLIILITAAGGAFGGMLGVAKVGPAIQGLFGSDEKAAGFMLMILGFVIAAVLKVAQGSSTVAMITAAGMLAAMMPPPQEIGFHPVYLATAIGAGSLMGSWMNDSGFWIFAKMGGLTETEALKSWTIMLLLLGITAMVMTVVLALAMPMGVS